MWVGRELRSPVFTLSFPHMLLNSHLIRQQGQAVCAVSVRGALTPITSSSISNQSDQIRRWRMRARRARRLLGPTSRDERHRVKVACNVGGSESRRRNGRRPVIYLKKETKLLLGFAVAFSGAWESAGNVMHNINEELKGLTH